MKILALALLTASFAGITGAAFALPVLETEVDTANRVVTVGDMFKDAGSLASQPLFLAPAPGTTGTVSIDAVRDARTLCHVRGRDRACSNLARGLCRRRSENRSCRQRLRYVAFG